MTVADPTVSPVHAFADRAWERFLELEPLWATAQGDDRWDDRLDDPGPVGRAAELALLDEWEVEMASLEGAPLSVEDAVTIGLVRIVIERIRRAHDLRVWEMEAVDQYGGPQALLGDLARLQPTDTPERFERLLARIAAYPEWLAAHRANLDEGVASGRTAAAPVLERCITQTRRIVETPAAASPLVLANEHLSAAQRSQLIEAIERDALPAQRKWLDTLEAYAGHVRAGDGICHLADGQVLYRHYILSWTTLSEDPESIHQYGQERLAAIERQEVSIAAELGYHDVASLRRALETDPDNHAATPADLVAFARALIDRAQAVAPAWFGRLPTDGCEVRAVEPHMEQEAPPAFYMQPSEDGTRKGIYFINTYDPPSRHLHRLAATTFHEAVPGHHFQIAIEQELGELPGFRRFGSRLAGGAYVEGWALYTERLASEMGLYETPLERFGALETEGWRAARLVVDTGIHELGWSRQRSIDFLRDRAGLSLLEAETETDRYISWPGQALSYMIGQREILSLREQLEQRDGASFDLRAFHDEAIGHGSLPLAILREELPGWVKPSPA